MIRSKNFFTIFADRILAILLVAIALFRLSHQSPFVSLVVFLDLVVKPLAVITFLFLARIPKKQNLTIGAGLGLVLSYLSPIFMAPTSAMLTTAQQILGGAATLFFLSTLVWTYFTLGRNLGIVPAIRRVTVTGLYGLVRHPIYSGYLHLAVTFVAMFPSAVNFLCGILLSVGLLLRLKAEEALLSETEEYRQFKLRVKNSIFHPYLGFPVVILLAVSIVAQKSTALPHSSKTTKPIRLALALPVLSLDPTVYDDWGSVFVGNHIFPRLSEDSSPGVLKVLSKDPQLRCRDKKPPVRPDDCTHPWLELTVNNETKDCSGRPLTTSVIQHELKLLLKKKTWILPGWRFCSGPSEGICLEGPQTKDVLRRLQNLYFRFGWSLITPEDQVFGVGPYCLSDLNRQKNEILSGILLPKTHVLPLPSIYFFTSAKKDADFDIALYGSEDLLSSVRVNLNAHTPLAYYVVSNPKYHGDFLPWNTTETAEAIKKHLATEGILEPASDPSLNLVPKGHATEHGGTRVQYYNVPYMLALPDFIPNCKNLAEVLVFLWKASGWVHAKAVCTDTNMFIENNVRQKRDKWYGFMTPLTPGAPGRHAIRYQYFSPDSSESWIQNTKTPEDSFFLVGLGKSVVTANKARFCQVKQKSMGLGDIFILDFLPCGEGALLND